MWCLNYLTLGYGGRHSVQLEGAKPFIMNKSLTYEIFQEVEFQNIGARYEEFFIKILLNDPTFDMAE